MAKSRRSTDRASKTATLAAAVRAHHLIYDENPIFRDDFALTLCGPLWRTILTFKPLKWLVVDKYLGRLLPVHIEIFTRARFGEDRIEQAVNRGVSQCIFVGAGFESIAMRRRDLADKLKVFELDQRATQTQKIERMFKAGIEKPENLHFVEMDARIQTVAQALEGSEFDFTKPAIVSCFGLTYYLSREDIATTLGGIIGNLARGSSVMFDYLAEINSVPEQYRRLHAECSEFVGKLGEPWISSFEPDEMPEFLKTIGFEEVEHLKPEEMNDQYFADRAEAVFPPMFGFCHASTHAD